MAKSRSVTGSDEIELEVRFCAEHKNQEIRMYCSDHKSFGCGECMLFHHKVCKHEYITEAAERFQDSGEFSRFLEEIQDLEESHRECNSSITTMKERIDKITKDLESIEPKIKSISTDIQQDDNIYKRFMLAIDMGPKLTKIRETLESIETDDIIKQQNDKFSDLSSMSTSLDTLTVNKPDHKVGKSSSIPSQKMSPNKSKVLQLVASNKAACSESKQQKPVKQQNDDDLVYETFYHRSDKEFQCIYQSGMRFYLDDCGSKEWQPFPKRWYNEGLLVTNTILKNENAEQESVDNYVAAAGQGQSTSIPQCLSQGNSGGGGGGGSDGGNNDREGFLMHPTKGRVPTYIFYKKHNIHLYFDRDTGSWVRMPIAWELHHDTVKGLVDQIEKAVPTWGDRHDMLSLLRACNYDPDECIRIYLHLQGDEWMKTPKTNQENQLLKEKEARIHKNNKAARK